MIRPTHPDGTPLTIREQLERAGAKKAKRAAKAAALWPAKVKRKKLPSVSRLEAVLWDQFSFYIRLRDKRANAGLCFYCERRPIQCAMHRVKRGKRATKYDERNVHGGCHSCNFEDNHNPQKFDAIFIRKLGATLFLDLVALGAVISKRTRVDVLAVTAIYREKVRTLLAA
jgi:hypothetical protein